jgi:hypothetical protein
MAKVQGLGEFSFRQIQAPPTYDHRDRPRGKMRRDNRAHSQSQARNFFRLLNVFNCLESEQVDP